MQAFAFVRSSKMTILGRLILALGAATVACAASTSPDRNKTAEVYEDRTKANACIYDSPGDEAQLLDRRIVNASICLCSIFKNDNTRSPHTSAGGSYGGVRVLSFLKI